MRKYEKIGLPVLSAIMGLCAVLGLTVPRRASANSAPSHYYGSTGSGSFILTDCPVSVRHEQLTFNVGVDADIFGIGERDPAEYKNTVTAEYTFYNPEDYDVHATLAFPFGNMPDYLWRDNDFESFFTPDNITVDGTPVETRLRHTYAQYIYGEFDVDGQLERLCDDYTDSFFVDKTKPIYRYDFTLLSDGGFAFFDYDGLNVCTNISGWTSCGPTKHKGLFTKADGNSYTVYVFGEEIDVSGRTSFYTDSRLKTPTSGKVTKSVVEELTYDDFIFGSFDEEKGVSRVDWHNAAVEIIDGTFADGYTLGINDMNFYDSLMCWFEYDVDFPARSTVVNSVTAPMFPSIDADYSPDLFEYNYLLTPASKWDSFSDLDIRINTDAYLIEKSAFANFEETDGGYSLHLDDLPENDLSFTLCESEDPEHKYSAVGHVLNIAVIALIVVIAIFVVYVLGVTISLCVLESRRSK